jgi:ADP-ribose pyrophosphatase YjhB (NUDIX family)
MKRVTAAGGIVINEDGEILLMYRRSKWDLPKGHLDKGETLEQCAIREVGEETGLKSLKIVRPIGITEHQYFNHYNNEDEIKETHWFEMRATKNESLQPQEEESIEWIRWVPADELSNYLRNSYHSISNILKQAGIIH